MDTKNKKKLTMEMLNDALPGQMLLKGGIQDSPEGFFIDGTKQMLKWVAIIGGINDWCIYVSYLNLSCEELQKRGYKIMKDTAKIVIDADKEVWERWKI